jgi:membrane-associated protease RseP (regulator of RpoE activity)
MEILLYLLGIFVLLVGVALSIGLHEIGHLVPAKLFGVRVKQYMIGFGPTLWSRKSGETEYGVKAIPLGGYILMSGMYPPERKPYRGPFSTWINEARQHERKDQIVGEEHRQFYQLSAPRKLIVMLGGPFMNLVLGVVLIVTALVGIGPVQPSLTVSAVFDCVEGTTCSVPAPAKTAGIEPGDEILAINGIPVENWPQAIELLRKDTSGSNITVLRGEQRMNIGIKPVFVERQVFDESGRPIKDDNGIPETELRPVIGVQLGSQNTPISIAAGFDSAMQVVAGTFGFILDLPNQLYKVFVSTFGLADRDQSGVVSIIGVGQLAGELTSSDGLGFASKLGSLLLLIGSLNIALFAFNLIPLLPLDGGHVVSAIYEGLKRRIQRLFLKRDPGPIDTARALPVAYAVWVLLIFVGVILILADLINPIRLL